MGKPAKSRPPDESRLAEKQSWCRARARQQIKLRDSLIKRSLDANFAAHFFEGLFERLGIGLGNAFLDGLGSRFHQGFGFA